MCDSALCVRDRERDALVERGQPEELRKLITELRNDECCMGEELSVYKAIMDGSWPSAMKQLTEALERAKAKNPAA